MTWDGSWGWGMGWMMMFGWLVPLLVLGLIVYVVVQAADRGRSAALYPPAQPQVPAPPRVKQETALEIAQRRYASGELSREEFVGIRDDLEGSGTRPSG